MRPNPGIYRALLAIAALIVAAACTRDATGPREVGRHRDVYALPEIDAYTCRYGGEYPNCSPPPTGETTGPETKNPGTEPPPPGGSYPPPDSTTACDPSTDPKCEKPITNADSAAIRASLTRFVRPDSAIADTTNRRLCGEMRNKFQERFDADKVFRGTYDSQGGDGHYGAAYDGHIHFDPWILGEAAKGSVTAMRELANTALHEAAHTAGHSHPRGTDANGHYLDSPFHLLDKGPNVCLS